MPVTCNKPRCQLPPKHKGPCEAVVGTCTYSVEGEEVMQVDWEKWRYRAKHPNEWWVVFYIMPALVAALVVLVLAAT